MRPNRSIVCHSDTLSYASMMRHAADVISILRKGIGSPEHRNDPLATASICSRIFRTERNNQQSRSMRASSSIKQILCLEQPVYTYIEVKRYAGHFRVHDASENCGLSNAQGSRRTTEPPPTFIHLHTNLHPMSPQRPTKLTRGVRKSGYSCGSGFGDASILPLGVCQATFSDLAASS